MKREIYLSSFFIALILLMISCGGPSPANDASNSNLTNENANVPAHGTVANRNNEPTINNAPTLKPVVDQYYEALKTKDDEKLKETLTAAFLKNIEDDMKAENKKGLAAFVAETDYREGQSIEVRNQHALGGGRVDRAEQLPERLLRVAVRALEVRIVVAPQHVWIFHGLERGDG